ncbi:MAG: DUF3102 domain-containing protein [Stellaceae bacterium]
MDALNGSNNRLPILAAEIRREHEAAIAATKRGLEHAITAGERLLEAKAHLKHGEWLPWLAAHCAIPDRTARFYMRFARNRERIEAKSATIADLTLRAAAQLLAPEGPENEPEADPADWRRPLAPGEIELPIDRVTFRKDLYPRSAPVPDTIERYKLLLPYLDAIEISQNNVIIDGVMRWLAHRQLGIKEIRCRITEVASDVDHLMIAIERNSTHSVPLPIDKELEIAEKRHGEATIEALADGNQG